MLGLVARSALDVAGRPVDALTRAACRADVLTLIYHRAGRRTPSPVDLDTDAFRDQLDLLAETGRVVALADAVRLLAGDGIAPSEGAGLVITVDDGTTDWPDVMMPELIARGLPATFYVSTDFVEGQRPFPDDGSPVSWAGLRDMLATGLVTIGSHTHTHRVMADLSAGEAREEVDRSIGLIEDRLGVTPVHFAYPKAIAPSPAAEVVVRRRFVSATLAGNRGASRGADMHRLGRHALTIADDRDSFARKVNGGMVLEGWVRERRDAYQVRRRAPA